MLLSVTSRRAADPEQNPLLRTLSTNTINERKASHSRGYLLKKMKNKKAKKKQKKTIETLKIKNT